MSTLTQPQPAQPVPELTILQRVASIPVIHSSLETIDNTLNSNVYTRSTYSAAKEISSSAYKYTEPLQVKLAPLINRADVFANAAVDAVESRYPYAFKTKPEDIAKDFREKQQSASASVNKTIDERFKAPAFNVAQGIDQRFTPIVDYLDAAAHKFQPETPTHASSESQFQYQRALAISKDLTDSLRGFSSEQLKQIQAQSALLQRATETAQSITNLASSSLANAQTRIHGLSENMLSELQRIQASLQTSASSRLQQNIDSLQHHIPPQVQQTYSELSTNLSGVIADLKSTVLEKDLPVQEKVSRVGHQVKESISPLLDTLRKGVEGLLAGARSTSQEAASAVSENAEGAGDQTEKAANTVSENVEGAKEQSEKTANTISESVVGAKEQTKKKSQKKTSEASQKVAEVTR